jgi:CrcB protein
MMNLSLVALGGALGSAMRYLVGLAAARLMGPAFPWGTLAVNIAGSLAMGVLFAMLVRRAAPPSGFQLFLMTGMLGGFTTFSAFSLETALLWERGETLSAMLYVFASVSVSIAALAAGLALARAWM